ITSERGRIVGESRDPRRTEDPVHLAYHERNLARGRPRGLIRIRVRYRMAKTPWFDYLMVSPDELRELLSGTGWRLTRTIDSDDTYVAIIEKEPRARAPRSAAAG